MSARDFVMHPAVIRGLNRVIRAAFRRGREGSDGPPRVLIAGGEPGSADALRRLLETAGLAVSTVADGSQAPARLRERPADLVLLHTGVPESRDLELIATLLREAPWVKIIAITSEGGECRQYLRPAESFGAVTTLVRPIRPSDLLAAVERLLRGGPEAGESRNRNPADPAGG